MFSIYILSFVDNTLLLFVGSAHLNNEARIMLMLNLSDKWCLYIWYHVLSMKPFIKLKPQTPIEMKNVCLWIWVNGLSLK